MAAMKHLVLQLLLLAAIAGCVVQGFQSDELPDDAEEWGLVGDAPPLIRNKAVITPEVEYNNAMAMGRKKASVGAAGAKKVTFPLEHSLGDGKFSMIGTFTGILRTSVSDSGQERQVH